MFFFVHDINNRIKTPVKPSQSIKPVEKLDAIHSTKPVTAQPQSADSIYPSTPKVARDPTEKKHRPTYTEDTITAADIMSSPIITVESSATAEEIEALMEKIETKHLVVTDNEGFIAGIISKEELISHLRDYPGETDIELKSLGKIYSSPPATPIKDVAGLMLHHRLDAVLVMENDFAVGIITTTNFLEFVAFRENTIDTHS